MSKIFEDHIFFCIGIFLIILALSSPWFNLTVSSHDFVKTYFASIGISFLMLMSYYFKLNKPLNTLKINYLKLSLLAIFVYGALSIFWSINFDFTLNKLLMWLIAAFSFLFALNL